MSDTLCTYNGDREATLMAYLYDEIGPEARVEFETHLAACARCRVDLGGFEQVRHELSRWSPPGAAPNLTIMRTPDVAPRRGWWREIPAWAQVAAATIILGVSAGIANLDVRYGNVSIHTGWSRSAAPATTVGAMSRADGPAASPWRGDLVALEQQLRNEIRAAVASAPAAEPAQPRNASFNDSDVMRRVKSLVDDSERRQRNELVLRLAETLRDLNIRRDADLRKIDKSLDVMFDRTGVEVMKNRQMIDFYMQRVSQRP